ncbi:DMT family transporter [Paenibacillus sanguinis]|uniref:DMT family transporter n=1 Tax=Paenibacillus sanguinis TaxID=225906 RepID=UPI00037E301C|nr:multidrug efflux SMR transporter [Paenibacillus sanguinis]
MNKHWLLVIVAALFEVMWVAGLKHANNGLEWALTAVAIIISFAGLVYGGKKLPTSTVYAIFVGLGTAGTVVTEMVLFDVPFSWGKVWLILSLLVGIIGLKLITTEGETEPKQGGMS